MNHHYLRLELTTQPFTTDLNEPPPVDTTLTIEASGQGLEDVWAEVIHQMPRDVYAALYRASRRE